MVVAATVFSHFLLDALVHVVGLPLLGPRAGARWGLAGAVALCALLTVGGGLATTPPPSAGVLAMTSLSAIGLLSGLAFWLDPCRAAR